MDIASANHMSGAILTGRQSQPSQDSHEKNIHNQIVNLQGKMRDLAYDTKLSEDEKSDKKKKLKEQIQNLNSELKQYKINKRREENGQNQDEAIKGEKGSDEKAPQTSTGGTDSDAQAPVNAADETVKAVNSDISATASDSAIDKSAADEAHVEEQEAHGKETVEMMILFSNTMQQFSNMGKIQTQLSGMMRTAKTDEEKIELQGKINSVADAVSAETDKNARRLSEIRDEELKKKEKRRRMLEEQEAKKENMKASVPTSGKSVLGKSSEYGKVLLTRKKS